MSQSLMRRRTGMGVLGAGEGPDPFDPWSVTVPDPWSLGDVVEVYPTDPTFPSRSRTTTNSAPPWWAILGPGIVHTVRDIFAPVGTSQAAYGAQRPTVYAGAGYTDQYGNVIPRTIPTTTQGIGAQVESFVRNNSTLLLLGVGLVALVQMPGFTRRGR